MNLFLSLAYLFFIGSVLGWVLELFFRKFFSGSNPEHKWINPGFCTGPYVPLYGFGLCILYLLASLGERTGLAVRIGGKALLVLAMAVCMTGIEYLAGILSLKMLKVRLWDYSKLWGNIDGLICPLFSLIWAVMGAGYYFLLHCHILNLLHWLENNLAFSFVIGFFFGVFVIDAACSIRFAARLKRFAEENGVVVKYENLKSHIHAAQEAAANKVHFFFAFHSERPLTEHLIEAHEAVEKIKRKHRASPGERARK